MTLPHLSMLALFVGLGSLLGPRRTWHIGAAALLAATLVAGLLAVMPGLEASVPRPATFALLMGGALAVGCALRAAVDLSGPERGRWVGLLPLVGALVSAAWPVAPVLFEHAPQTALALAHATVGNEQQTRTLLLPLVQPVAPWVPWGWGAVAALTAMLLLRGVRASAAVSALLWLGYAAIVGWLTVAVTPTKEAAEALARAALRPGEKVLSLQPLPDGPFAVEPNFYAVLLLLAISGMAVAATGTAKPEGQPSGEPAALGLVASLLAFALVATAQAAVGMPLPTMHGVAGILLVSALCFAAALFGQQGSVRFASRLLLSLVLLFPWLLWGSLGALP